MEVEKYDEVGSRRFGGKKEGREGVWKWQTGARNSTVRDAADGADGAVSPERL